MKFFKFDENEGVGILTIQRPEALNALNKEVLEELNVFLTEAENNKSLRVLILTGAGEKAFVAGADIKEINSLNPDTAQSFSAFGQSVFRKIEKLHVPVIAAVNGFALGGGLELAMSCDFIYASEKAKFGLPEVTLGLIPGFGGTIRLARLIGLAKAREVVYTGQMYSAQEALQMGIVNRLFTPEELLTKAQETAKLISTRGPVAVKRAKQTLQKGFDLEIDGGMTLEAHEFSALFHSQDQREGTSAFIEKRKPVFKGN